MTNAQKYEEIFGFPPYMGCPTTKCAFCPLVEMTTCKEEDWWNSEYEESKR